MGVHLSDIYTFQSGFFCSRATGCYCSTSGGSVIITMSTSPIIDPVLPLTTRLSLGAQVWAFKAVSTTVISTSRVLAPSVFRTYSPTYTRQYPVRSMLSCRFFIPNTYESGSQLPLYIDIHGGGFFAGTPLLDDKICHYLCNKFSYVVVSV